MLTIFKLMTLGLIMAVTCASADPAVQGHTSLEEIDAERNYYRAKEAAIWSQPAIGVAMTLKAIRSNGGDLNDIVYLSQPANWKWQILTPNSVSLYVTSVLRTSENTPMVIEVPAKTGNVDIFGTIMDSFQVPLVDVGSSGADQGAGAKYLILPADHQGEVPSGYIPVSTERNMSYIMFRVIPESFEGSDLNDANRFVKNVKIYPLNNPGKQARYIDMYDKAFDTVDPRDASYFDYLTSFLNLETVVERDLAIMSMMKSFGYEHGQPFKPDADTRKMLDKATASALDELIIMTRDIAGPWWEGNMGWMQPTKPIGPMTQFRYVTDTEYATDARGETYSMYCCAPAELGAATAYVYASRDTDGDPLQAQSTYKLHVPANVPVSQFWSLTAYDALTAVFFENVDVTDISSLDTGLKYNDDGSIDLYVGPEAPSGKAGNWIETNSKNNSIFLFRFYGPEPGVRDGSWVLNGFEKYGE